LIEDIENAFIQGQNWYTTTITAAYNLLVNWKQDPRNFVQYVGPSNNSVSNLGNHLDNRWQPISQHYDYGWDHKT
jgi:hypothetical protein